MLATLAVCTIPIPKPRTYVITARRTCVSVHVHVVSLACWVAAMVVEQVQGVGLLKMATSGVGGVGEGNVVAGDCAMCNVQL